MFALLAPRTQRSSRIRRDHSTAARFSDFGNRLQEAIGRIAGDTDVDTAGAHAQPDEMLGLVNQAAASGSPVAGTAIDLQPEDWPEPARRAAQREDGPRTCGRLAMGGALPGPRSRRVHPRRCRRPPVEDAEKPSIAPLQVMPRAGLLHPRLHRGVRGYRSASITGRRQRRAFMQAAQPRITPKTELR